MSEINRLLQGYGGIVPTPEPHDARWIEDMRRIWAAERKRAAETYEREVAQALEQAQAAALAARLALEGEGGIYTPSETLQHCNTATPPDDDGPELEPREAQGGSHSGGDSGTGTDRQR